MNPNLNNSAITCEQIRATLIRVNISNVMQYRQYVIVPIKNILVHCCDFNRISGRLAGVSEVVPLKRAEIPDSGSCVRRPVWLDMYAEQCTHSSVCTGVYAQHCRSSARTGVFVRLMVPRRPAIGGYLLLTTPAIAIFQPVKCTKYLASRY